MAKVYLENTTVSAAKSIAEIQEVLLRSGANNINQRIQERRVVGLSFTLITAQGDMLFDLPARIESVYQYLRKQRSPRTMYSAKAKQSDAEASVRIAWRQILYWIRAQFALIELGMAESTEVFLPYLVVPGGQSLFEHMKGGGMKQITGGKNV